MTPEGVHGDEVGAVLHQFPDVHRVKAVDVLLGGDGVEDPPLRIGAHRRRQRRLHQDAVVDVAPVQPFDDREQLRQRSGRRQTLQIGAQSCRRRPISTCCGRRSPRPGCRRPARCRARAAGRRALVNAATPGASSARIAWRRAAPSSRRAVITCACASASRSLQRFRTAEHDQLVARPRSRVSGSGLNSMRRSCRWMPTMITPNRCRRFASRIDRAANGDAARDRDLLHRELEVVGARRQRDEIDDCRPQRRLRHLNGADLIRRDHAIGAGALQLQRRVLASRRGR